MRLNRSTLILLAACVLIIVGVLLVNNNQQNAAVNTALTPSGSPTVDLGGPLFPGLDATQVALLTITDNATGASSSYARGGESGWQRLNSTDTQALDATALNTRATDFAALEADDTFSSDSLAQFGLDTPAYTITATTTDGTRHLLHVGDENVSGNRYYVVAMPSQTAMSSAPVTSSETGVEATGEAVAPKRFAPPAQATFEVTPDMDMTSEALIETTDEMVPMATVIPELTLEAIFEATLEATAESTALPEPLVTLAGVQNVSTVPVQTVTNWLTLLTTPPYAPLPTPTFPLIEFTAEPTAEANDEMTMEAAEATVEIMPNMTVEAVGEGNDVEPTAAPTLSAERTLEVTPLETAGS